MKKNMIKAKDFIKNKWKEILLIIMGIVLIYMAAGNLNRKDIEAAVDKEPTIQYVGYDSKEPLDNFSKDGAIKALVSTLKELGENREGNEFTIEEKIKKVAEEELPIEDVLTDKAIEQLYYAEEFGEDDFNKMFTINALLTYLDLIVDQAGEDFSPIEEMVDSVVYLDSKLMTAHIPLDLLLGATTGVAFEMQYIDGEWKLNPYTATMSLHLMGMIEASKTPAE